MTVLPTLTPPGARASATQVASDAGLISTSVPLSACRGVHQVLDADGQAVEQSLRGLRSRARASSTALDPIDVSPGPLPHLHGRRSDRGKLQTALQGKGFRRYGARCRRPTTSPIQVDHLACLSLGDGRSNLDAAVSGAKGCCPSRNRRRSKSKAMVGHGCRG